MLLAPPRLLAPARWFPYVCLLVLVALVLGPVFRPGWLVSDAHPSRQAEVISEFEKAWLQQHWIAGWDQRLQCGYPTGVYQYQLSYIVICALALAGVPLQLGYKLVLFLGMWFTACMLLRWLRPHVGTGLALGVTVAFFCSESVVSQLAQGFWNHLVGLGCLLLLLRRLEAARDLRAATALPLMALYALIVLAHNYTAVAAGCFLLGHLPRLWRAGRWRALAWWLALPAGAVVLTLVYALPLAQGNAWLFKPQAQPSLATFLNVLFPVLGLTELNPFMYGGVAWPARLASVATAWPVHLALLLALALPLWARRLAPAARAQALALGIALVPLLFINLQGLHAVPLERVRESASSLIPERFLQYTHLIVFALGALALRHGLGLGLRRPPARAARWAVGVLVLLLAGVVLKDAWSLRRNQRLTTFEDLRHNTALEQLWAWLGTNAGGRHRVLVETTYENFPARTARERALAQSTIMALGPVLAHYASAGDLLNLVMPMHERTRTGNGRFLNVKVAEAQPGQFNSELWLGNFGYVVACSPRLIEFLTRDSGFAPAAEFGPFRVFRYLDAPGAWAATNDGSPVTFAFDPLNDARMRATVDARTSQTQLLVRVTHHPAWRARDAAGAAVALEPGPFGMITTAPLAGPGRRELAFEFRPAPRALLGVNAAAWVAWLLAAAIAGPRRRPTQFPE